MNVCQGLVTLGEGGAEKGLQRGGYNYKRATGGVLWFRNCSVSQP